MLNINCNIDILDEQACVIDNIDIDIIHNYNIEYNHFYMYNIGDLYKKLIIKYNTHNFIITTITELCIIKNVKFLTPVKIIVDNTKYKLAKLKYERKNKIQTFI